MTTIETDLDTVEITFCSDERGRGTSDYPVYLLKPTLDNVIGYSFVEANIPCSYYPIDAGNSSFILEYQPVSSSPTQVQVNFTAGSYTISQFQDALKTTLQQAIAGTVWTVVVNQQSGIMTLTETSQTLQAIAFNFQASLLTGQYGSMYEVMGFRPDEVMAMQLVATDWVLNTPSIVRLSGADRLYLRSQSLGPPLARSVRVGNNVSSSIIACVPVTAVFGQVIQFRNQDVTMIPMIVNSLTEIDLYLTQSTRTRYGVIESQYTPGVSHVDNKQTRLDEYMGFNGHPWSVTLRFYLQNKQKDLAMPRWQRDDGSAKPQETNKKRKMLLED